MATQIRNIITRRRDFLVGTTEDWIDGFPFFVAGDVAIHADPDNKGNGVIASALAQPITPEGLYRVTVTAIENGAAFFAISKRETDGDQDLAVGVAGQLVSANGLQITVRVGSTPFIVGDGFSLSVLHELQDVRDITFHLHLRRDVAAATYPATPVVFASSEAGTILNSGLLGVVNMAVPLPAMSSVEPRTYDYDLLAVADGLHRRVYFGTVEVIEGVTRIDP